jgi:hypothetical protein
MKFIHEYETKKLLVADFVYHTDGKVHIIIMNDDCDIVYEGRQENLAWTGEGAAHELCDKVVEYFDMGTHVVNGTRFGAIVLYLEEEK